MKYLPFVFLLLVPAVGYAQTPSPQQPTIQPAQEIIENTLGNLFITNQNLTERIKRLQVSIASLTSELAKAQTRIKELESKQEGKK